MEIVLILIRQIAQMFCLAALGFLLFKGRKISADGSKALGNILIYLALPSVIINSFMVIRTTEHMQGMLISAASAAVLLLLSMLISRAIFKKDAIAAFGSAFSNPGFFGIPLIIASVGQDEVFYVACYVAFLNIGQWTWGVSLMNGQPVREGLKAKKLIRAPFIIAILIGLVLFFSGLQLPPIISGCLSSVAALNTPLAMFTVGIYLAQTDILHMFRRTSLYLISAVRLVLIPMAAVFLLKLIPESYASMKMALLLVISCPVGSNIAVYAQLHDADYQYAVETVVLSTLFSIITIPAVVWLARLVW